MRKPVLAAFEFCSRLVIRRRWIAVGVVVSPVCSQLTYGTEYVWSNSGPTWTTAGNWSPPTGAPSVGGDFATFSTAMAVQPVLDASLSVGGIRFTSNANNYDIGGAGTITLTAYGPSSISTANSSGAGIYMAGTGVDSIENNLVLASANGTASTTITVGQGTLNLNGTLTGTIAPAFLVMGGATLNIARANSFSVPMTLNSTTGTGDPAVYGIGNDQAFGTSTVTVGGALTLVSSGSDHVLSNKLTLAANTVLSSAYNLTLAGPVTSTGAASRTLSNTGGGLATLSGPVYLAVGDSTANGLTFGGTGNFLVSGPVANNASGNTVASPLTVSTSGTVVLSGSNTFSGSTTINSGSTLQIGNNSTTGTLGAGSITDNGTLAFNRSDDYAMPAGITISGSGSLVKNGVGVLTLSGSNGYTGATTINQGTLSFASTLYINGNSTANNLAIANGATMRFTSSLASGYTLSKGITLTGGTDAIDVSSATGLLNQTGPIGGGGILFKTGPGTLKLNSANIYSGGTFINGGTLQVANNSGLGNGGTTSLPINTTVGNGSTLSFLTSPSYDATRVFTVYGNATVSVDSGFTATIASAVGGTGSLTKAGTGTLALTGANSFSGGLVLNAGTLSTNSDASFGDVATAAPITINGGTLAVSGVTTGRSITINSAATINSTKSSTFNGAITGSGLLTKTGSSFVYLNNGANSNTGGYDIAAGTLTFGTNEAFGPSTGTVTTTIETGGTLGLNGSTDGLPSGGTVNYTVASNRSIVLNGTGAQITVASGETWTIAGTLGNGANVGALNKLSSGTLYLTNAGNNFSGGLNISAGIVRANNTASGTGSNSATGSGPVDVQTGGTLGGRGTVTGTVTVESGGTVTAGSSSSNVGSLATGAEIWNVGGKFTGKFAAGSSASTAGSDYDTLNIGGTLNLVALSPTSGSQFNLILTKTSKGTFDLTHNASFKLATATTIATSTGTAVAGADFSKLFALDTSGLGLSNVSGGATYFSVGSSTGKDLTLFFDFSGGVATPEPLTAGLMGLGSTVVLSRRRLRCVEITNSQLGRH